MTVSENELYFKHYLLVYHTLAYFGLECGAIIRIYYA